MTARFQLIVFHIAVTAASLWSATLLAQQEAHPEGYTVREWGEEAGLLDDAVTQVLQDREGFLWIGTRRGLMRFDGSHFVEIPLGKEPTYIMAMVEAPDGSILLVPRNGHPLRLSEGTITTEPLPDPFTGKPVGTLAVAPDGAVWYTVPGAIIRILGNTVESFDASSGIDGKAWTGFAIDGLKRFWVASGRSLFRYEGGHLVPIPANTDGAELRIASSRKGGPWVVGTDRVWKCAENDMLTVFTEIPVMLGAHYLKVACESRDGSFWLGSRSQGVYRVEKNGPQHVPTSHEDVTTMIEDAESNLWAGTTSGGLKALAPKIYRLYNKNSGLRSNAATAVCEDGAGNIWLANGDGGVIRLGNSKFGYYPTLFEGKFFGANSVAPNPAGGAWVTGTPGLFRLREGADQVELFDTAPVSGLRRVMLSVKAGDLWLSADPDGVARLRNEKLTVFRAAEGFKGNVRTLTEDPSGKLWVGTSDSKVFHFENEQFHPVQDLPERALGAINSILFTTSGDMWLGTSKSGIVVFSQGKYVLIRKEEGLPDSNIFQLVQDEHGDVWCGSVGGIFRLEHRDVEDFLRHGSPRVTPLVLGKDEGLSLMVSTTAFGPNAIRSSNGTIWFATREGVLAIDPKANTLVAAKPPQVRIEDVRCDGVPGATRQTVDMPADAKKLEVRFSVLCLSAPSRARTWYRLEGFDSDWIPAPPNHTVVYSRPPPGKYRLEVRSDFGDVSHSRSVDSLAIIVSPHWWQLAWVQAGVVVALIAGSAYTVRARSHRRLKLRVEKLENETTVARERARIAQNIHDDVGASLTRISLLTQASVANPQQQVKNMDRIYEATREITRSLDEIVWAINPQYDTLESFVGYLTGYAQNYLATADIRCRISCPPELATIALSSEARHQLFLCCKEALHNVVKHAAASEVTISLQQENETLILSIADNGSGGRANPATKDRVLSGHGLKNIQERMTKIGGGFQLEAGPAGGMVVTLTLASKTPPHPQ